ncbi:MAG: hypothetical protein QHH07_05100 [Sedimentisphaerales bacterium]|jgi:hypothetical protein|nr:hypothetical protein [Sedimentisphaerales bacterium]
MQTEMDHWNVVKRGLAGHVDEQTIASLSILAERLERLRKAYPALAGVGFSPEVQALLSRTGHVHAI